MPWEGCNPMQSGDPEIGDPGDRRSEIGTFEPAILEKNSAGEFFQRPRKLFEKTKSVRFDDGECTPEVINFKKYGNPKSGNRKSEIRNRKSEIENGRIVFIQEKNLFWYIKKFGKFRFLFQFFICSAYFFHTALVRHLEGQS